MDYLELLFGHRLMPFMDADGGNGGGGTGEGAEGNEGKGDGGNGGAEGKDDKGGKGGKGNKEGEGEKITLTRAELNKQIDDAVNRVVARERTKAEEEKAEAEKLAKMDADQKAEYEREKLAKENAEYKEREAKREMFDTANDMLSKEGITNAPKNLINSIVTTDAKTTKENIDGFIAMFKDAVKIGVDEALKGEPPATGGTSKKTKSEIMAEAEKIADITERRKFLMKHKDIINAS